MAVCNIWNKTKNMYGTLGSGRYLKCIKHKTSVLCASHSTLFVQSVIFLRDHICFYPAVFFPSLISFGSVILEMLFSLGPILPKRRVLNSIWVNMAAFNTWSHKRVAAFDNFGLRVVQYISHCFKNTISVFLLRGIWTSRNIHGIRILFMVVSSSRCTIKLYCLIQWSGLIRNSKPPIRRIILEIISPILHLHDVPLCGNGRDIYAVLGCSNNCLFTDCFLYYETI